MALPIASWPSIRACRYFALKRQTSTWSVHLFTRSNRLLRIATHQQYPHPALQALADDPANVSMADLVYCVSSYHRFQRRRDAGNRSQQDIDEVDLFGVIANAVRLHCARSAGSPEAHWPLLRATLAISCPDKKIIAHRRQSHLCLDVVASLPPFDLSSFPPSLFTPVECLAVGALLARVGRCDESMLVLHHASDRICAGEELSQFSETEAFYNVRFLCDHQLPYLLCCSLLLPPAHVGVLCETAVPAMLLQQMVISLLVCPAPFTEPLDGKDGGGISFVESMKVPAAPFCALHRGSDSFRCVMTLKRLALWRDTAVHGLSGLVGTHKRTVAAVVLFAVTLILAQFSSPIGIAAVTRLIALHFTRYSSRSSVGRAHDSLPAWPLYSPNPSGNRSIPVIEDYLSSTRCTHFGQEEEALLAAAEASLIAGSFRWPDNPDCTRLNLFETMRSTVHVVLAFCEPVLEISAAPDKQPGHSWLSDSLPVAYKLLSVFDPRNSPCAGYEIKFLERYLPPPDNAGLLPDLPVPHHGFYGSVVRADPRCIHFLGNLVGWVIRSDVSCFFSVYSAILRDHTRVVDDVLEETFAIAANCCVLVRSASRGAPMYQRLLCSTVGWQSSTELANVHAMRLISVTISERFHCIMAQSFVKFVATLPATPKVSLLQINRLYHSFLHGGAGRTCCNIELPPQDPGTELATAFLRKNTLAFLWQSACDFDMKESHVVGAPTGIRHQRARLQNLYRRELNRFLLRAYGHIAEVSMAQYSLDCSDFASTFSTSLSREVLFSLLLVPVDVLDTGPAVDDFLPEFVVELRRLLTEKSSKCIPLPKPPSSAAILSSDVALPSSAGVAILLFLVTALPVDTEFAKVYSSVVKRYRLSHQAVYIALIGLMVTHRCAGRGEALCVSLKESIRLAMRYTRSSDLPLLAAAKGAIAAIRPD